MTTEDWLHSRVKLCQLITGPVVDSSNVQDSVEVVINTQSYPQPHYNPSSILLTLETFSGAFDELRGRRSDVKMNYMDQNALGPKPVQTDVVNHFAEMLSEDILDAAVRIQDTQTTKDGDISQRSEVNRWTMSDHEKLAKRLAAEIYSNALEELARHGCSAGRKYDEIYNEPASYLCSSMHDYDEEGSTMEIDNSYHRRSTINPTPLDDMAHLGSLDYPDAPPSTPLLPEMMKSRSSFTRKLKGGLAKEFLPSTPPPTPKDQQSLLEDKMTDSAGDKSEFMVRLIRSLSLACSQLGEDNGTEQENRFQSEISDYAAQLSAEIVHCITVAQAGSDRNIETPVRDVQVLADHLAEELIMTSIAEVMRSEREDRTSQEVPSHFENTTQASSDALLSESTPDIPPLEALRAMAGTLITHTLIQAFSELGMDPLQHATSKQLSDPASEPVPWEQGNDQYSNMGLHITNSHQIQTNVESETNYISPDSRTGTVEHIFAEKIVHEVLKCSIREASKCRLRSRQISVNSDRQSSSVASHAVMRAFISETFCRDAQELQCILLWAAASRMGASTLQIDLTDTHIQQQLYSVSLQAQFHVWTWAI